MAFATKSKPFSSGAVLRQNINISNLDWNAGVPSHVIPEILIITEEAHFRGQLGEAAVHFYAKSTPSPLHGLHTVHQRYLQVQVRGMLQTMSFFWSYAVQTSKGKPLPCRFLSHPDAIPQVKRSKHHQPSQYLFF